MNSELFVVRPNWTTVARIVSERLKKPYSATYIQNIASGVRTQRQIEPILRELGVMQDQIPSATAISEAAAA